MTLIYFIEESGVLKFCNMISTKHKCLGLDKIVKHNILNQLR